jgi:hypothetical protein
MAEENTDPVTNGDEIKGAFMSSLVRSNNKIRKDRAIAIAEAAEMIYKREVEDLAVKIKQLKRERDNMLDLSPENAQSLVLASDFDAKAFVNKDIELGVQLRNLEIKMEIASTRYTQLFT